MSSTTSTPPGASAATVCSSPSTFPLGASAKIRSNGARCAHDRGAVALDELDERGPRVVAHRVEEPRVGVDRRHRDVVASPEPVDDPRDPDAAPGAELDDATVRRHRAASTASSRADAGRARDREPELVGTLCAHG